MKLTGILFLVLMVVFGALAQIITPPSSSSSSSSSVSVSDAAYDASSWNGVTNVAPSKNATRDILEFLVPSSGRYPGAMLTPWVGTNNVISLAWRKSPQIWEFFSSSAEWSTLTANSGSVSVPANTVDTADVGQWSGVTGVLTNGVGGHRINSSGVGFSFSTNSTALMFRLFTPAALSSDADGYEIYAGFGDSSGDAEPVDGAYFYYIHSVSNGVWCAKTSANSVRTFATGAPTTPPTVAATQWYNLLLEGTSTLVNFWVSTNDGASWQFIGYSNSNIPATLARATMAQIYIRKVGGSVGTTSRTLTYGRCVLWPHRAN